MTYISLTILLAAWLLCDVFEVSFPLTVSGFSLLTGYGVPVALSLGISAISLILLGKLLYAAKILWQAFWESIEAD